MLINTDLFCSLTTHPYAVNNPEGNCRRKNPTLILMELRQGFTFCFVFSSLETDMYKVVTSLQDNASASANHNIFSTDFMQRLWKGARQAPTVRKRIRRANATVLQQRRKNMMQIRSRPPPPFFMLRS